MPVELDPLDGLDQTMIHWTSRPGANPYWCYIQCEGCDVGWIWREKLGKGEPWTFKCYNCGQTWRESFWENGGWYYWNPVTKSRELDRQEGSHDHGPCQRAHMTMGLAKGLQTQPRNQSLGYWKIQCRNCCSSLSRIAAKSGSKLKGICPTVTTLQCQFPKARARAETFCSPSGSNFF